MPTPLSRWLSSSLLPQCHLPRPPDQLINSSGRPWRDHLEKGVLPISEKQKKTNPATRLAEQSQQAVADAIANERRRRDEVAEAKATITDYEGRWARGDETVTVTDMTVARDVLTRATNLLAAAEREVTKARRNLVNDNESLARALVPTVEAMLPGIPVEVHTIKPTGDPETTPVIRVVQAKVPDYNTVEGTVSGVVSISAYLPEFVKVNPFKGEAFTKALEAVGITGDDVTIDQISEKPNGGTVKHGATVTIPRGTESVPIISGEPQTFRVSTLAQDITADVVWRSGWADRRNAPPVNAVKPEATILMSRVDPDGITRRTAIEVVIKAVPRTAGTYAGGRTQVSATSSEIGGYIAAALDARAGTFVAGLGRVESVKTIETKPYYGAGIDVRAQVNLVSRTAVAA